MIDFRLYTIHDVQKAHDISDKRVLQFCKMFIHLFYFYAEASEKFEIIHLSHSCIFAYLFCSSRNKSTIFLNATLHIFCNALLPLIRYLFNTFG